MDLTDPRFIQAFMKSEEAKTSNIPDLFNPMIRTSKSMKTTYEPEKYFLETQFEKNTLPQYFEMVKTFYKQTDPIKIKEAQEDIWRYIESLSEYEIYLLMHNYESQFFNLRMSAIEKAKASKLTSKLSSTDLAALIKREIFLQQSKILKEMMDFGIPSASKMLRYIDDNLYIFADIYSREEGNEITNYDFNVHVHPMTKYRNYYYKLFDNDNVNLYVPDRKIFLKRLENYLTLSE
jgi:hypothetical protein